MSGHRGPSVVGLYWVVVPTLFLDRFESSTLMGFQTEKDSTSNSGLPRLFVHESVSRGETPLRS